MSPILLRMCNLPAGMGFLDVLMKYIYRGMARCNNNSTSTVLIHPTGVSSSSGGTTREFGIPPSRGDGGGMSVLLSWHEKVSYFYRAYCHSSADNSKAIDIAGTGTIVRVMTDTRIV